MAFNHYARLKRILAQEHEGWVVMRIDEPTQAKNFKGSVVMFDHYYRIFDKDGKAIPYCKFQQIERLAQVLGVSVEELPIAN